MVEMIEIEKPCEKCGIISRDFDISPRTLKPFPWCRKCRLKGVDARHQMTNCVVCRKRFRRTKKYQRTCSDFCERERMKKYVRKCVVCGGLFTPTRPHQKTDNDTCEEKRLEAVKLYGRRYNTEYVRKWRAKRRAKACV